MDNICEQLVVSYGDGKIKLKKVLISIAAILLGTLFMWLAIMFSIFGLVIFAVVALGGGIYLCNGMDVEYEYIITNNEMDIDKIIGRRKRKRMITLDLKTAEEFAPYPYDGDISVDATVHATSGLEKDAHYLLLNHADYGKVMLLFNPNEKTREAIMLEIPNQLRIKIKNNGR